MLFVLENCITDNSLYIVSPCNEWFDNGKLKNLCYCNLQNVTCPYLNSYFYFRLETLIIRFLNKIEYAPKIAN